MVSVTVVTAVAGLFIILRVISRFVVMRSPGAEDYCILAAMGMSIGLAISVDLRTSSHDSSFMANIHRTPKWPRQAL